MDCTPQIHVAAYHAKAGYNGDTPGIGALCRTGVDTRLAVGTYFNSLRKQSAYASVVWQPVAIGPMKAGLAGGFLTGYQDYAIPFAAAVVSLPVGPIEMHLTMVPASQSVSPATVELSFSFKF